MNENINTCIHVCILTYIIPVSTPNTGILQDFTGITGFYRKTGQKVKNRTLQDCGIPVFLTVTKSVFFFFKIQILIFGLSHCYFFIP